MTYDTIPIPQINFADEAEKVAGEISWMYFKSDFNIGYVVDNAKNHIKGKIIEQEKDDRIVILSFLINKLTEKLYNLQQPKSDFERSVQERDARPTYKSLLHFLYRLIEKEGIEIPSDVFSQEEYHKAQRLLIDITFFLDNKKVEFPTKENIINSVKNKVEQSKKFLFLGKEKWAELLIAAFLSFIMDKELAVLFPVIIKIITTYFNNVYKLY